MTTDSLKSPALRHNSEYQSPHPPPRASLKPLSGIPKCRVNSQAPPPGAAAPPLCLPLQITLGHLSTEAQPPPESSCPQWDRRQHGSSLYAHCCQCLDLLFLSIQPLGPHPNATFSGPPGSSDYSHLVCPHAPQAHTTAALKASNVLLCL